MTCCFSGHRDIRETDYTKIKERLSAVVDELIRKGVHRFESGGAFGFDTLAAMIILEKKKQFSNIYLKMVYPCKNQTRFWSEEQKQEYEYIKKNCDEYIYVTEAYCKGCMHQRNRYMVEESSFCVCYLTNTKGGTAYTIDYALKRGLAVINIAKAASGE